MWFGVRVSTANLGYNLRDSSWGVALISELPIVSEQLGQLREVGISCKGFFDGLAVEDVGIRDQLNAVVCNLTIELAKANPGYRTSRVAVSIGTLLHDAKNGDLGFARERSDVRLRSSGIVSFLITAR